MLAFDTHNYVKELQAAGFTEAQAEVHASTLKNIIENDLATKQDIELIRREIKELETKMESRFKELETKMESRFKELETTSETRFKELETTSETRFKELETTSETRLKELELRLTTRLGGMLVVGIAVVATLVKLL